MAKVTRAALRALVAERHMLDAYERVSVPCSRRASTARNPLGDGRLRSSALSFVGDDHPGRQPSHFAPIDCSSPPRDPRDFCHGLLDQVLLTSDNS